MTRRWSKIDEIDGWMHVVDSGERDDENEEKEGGVRERHLFNRHVNQEKENTSSPYQGANGVTFLPFKDLIICS